MSDEHVCILGFRMDCDGGALVLDPMDFYSREDDVFRFCPDCGKPVEIDWEAVEAEKARRVEEARQAKADRKARGESSFVDLLDDRFEQVWREAWREVFETAPARLPNLFRRS